MQWAVCDTWEDVNEEIRKRCFEDGGIVGISPIYHWGDKDAHK